MPDCDHKRDNEKMTGNLVIIGAGASGMMAAVQAARLGARVTLLECNDRPGRKLNATGNGRCNFTNLDQPAGAYRSSLPGFEIPVLSSFSVQDTIRFFTGLGIYSVNRNGGMYPRSLQAQSMTQALVMELERLKVRIKTRERVTAIRKEESGFVIFTEGWQYPADCVILAAGSCASQVQGSGRDGYQLAADLGHSVIEPLPALTGLKCRGASFTRWDGVRTHGAVALYVDGETVAREEGEIQLTSYGISGIPVFCLSRYAVRALHDGCDVRAELDFFPDLSLDEFRSFLKKRENNWPDRTPKDLLCGLFPEKLCAVLARETDIPATVKAYPLIVTAGQDFPHAQVCSGGVDPVQVDPFTLRSRLVPGLFFCGELLDVDGTCGGYNLQWAWSSGAAAGRNAVSCLKGMTS